MDFFFFFSKKIKIILVEIYSKKKSNKKNSNKKNSNKKNFNKKKIF